MSAPDIVVISTADDFAALRTEWNDFAWSTPGSSFFQSADWVSAWWEVLAGQPETVVALWRNGDGAIDAIAAVSRARERLHRKVLVPVSFWANSGSGVGAADHVGFVVSDHRTDDVRAWLGTLEGSVLVRNVGPEAKYLPEDARPIVSTLCPRLAIPPDDQPIGRSAKYRKRLRRNSRILRERGLEFTAVAGPDITAEMMGRLMEMHEARSDDKEWGSTFTPGRIAFHEALIGLAADGRGPALMVATQGSEIVGVLYGFWWNNSFSYFQTGWDPTWWELSLGSALVHEMVLHARSRGAVTFDFLRGPEEYKYRFGAEDQVDTDWLVARGVSGSVLAAKARLR